MNRTLNSLFPDIPLYENKIIAFLETCYNFAWSQRATAKELGINHKTVKNILDSIKDTPQYHAFVSKLEIQIKNFQDPVFQNKIFDRYEDTLKYIEARIKQADQAKDKASTLQLLRLKASVLKDQLGASIKAREHYTTKEDMADAIQSLAIDAWETENDKVQ